MKVSTTLVCASLLMLCVFAIAAHSRLNAKRLDSACKASKKECETYSRSLYERAAKQHSLGVAYKDARPVTAPGKKEVFAYIDSKFPKSVVFVHAKKKGVCYCKDANLKFCEVPAGVPKTGKGLKEKRAKCLFQPKAAAADLFRFVSQVYTR